MMTKKKMLELASAITLARGNIDDQVALKAKILYPKWENLIGVYVDPGVRFTYGEDLYKVLQGHVCSAEWVPGVGTESMYTRIDEEHAGTLEDPIPYEGNMELFNGKYYIQNDVVYLCNRDSGAPLYHALKDLVGTYVVVA